mmetsp:Transcript_17645/g.35347  ORF Transcript_17645/g.35347 Transcript_17645/m.35347 type:complete len:208 (-) Transcript_17645:827-1450(-)
MHVVGVGEQMIPIDALGIACIHQGFQLLCNALVGSGAPHLLRRLRLGGSEVDETYYPGGSGTLSAGCSVVAAPNLRCSSRGREHRLHLLIRERGRLAHGQASTARCKADHSFGFHKLVPVAQCFDLVALSSRRRHNLEEVSVRGVSDNDGINDSPDLVRCAQSLLWGRARVVPAVGENQNAEGGLRAGFTQGFQHACRHHDARVDCG